MSVESDERGRDERRGRAAVLRRIWRLHFWVGLFAAPTLVLLACTGLIILYTQPLDLRLHRNLQVVSPAAETVPLDTQIATARDHVDPAMVLDAVTPPAGPDRSTRVDFLPASVPETGERNVTQVFVDPYSGDYLGQRDELDGLVGWANQLHRLFGNDGPTVKLPSVGHLIAPSSFPDASITVGIGGLIIEMAAVWVLVLAASGIYLWWPRAVERGKPRLIVRWRKGGRIRWRDLHASTGILLSVALIFYIVSGLTWSRYWGENWRAVSSTLTPAAAVEAPSTPARLGDFDRLGRPIAWADKDDPLYASAPSIPVSKPLSFNDIDQIAQSEGMIPGYSIMPPSNDGQTYGSYTVVNHWPQRLTEQRTLYLDQFTGQTIADASAAQDGALSRATGWAVNMHMGTQYGVLTRILATAVCVGLLTSILSAALMWWRRRPTGTAGLPGRTSEAVRSATPRGAVTAIGLIATALAVTIPVPVPGKKVLVFVVAAEDVPP
ncbi:MAG: PepSY domain-containing protein [Mycobacterium sp.]|nr:PepSY domain-containing protein [Mycobacterium sp.]